jgi:hypothetical protein
VRYGGSGCTCCCWHQGAAWCCRDWCWALPCAMDVGGSRNRRRQLCKKMLVMLKRKKKNCTKPRDAASRLSRPSHTTRRRVSSPCYCCYHILSSESIGPVNATTAAAAILAVVGAATAITALCRTIAPHPAWRCRGCCRVLGWWW